MRNCGQELLASQLKWAAQELFKLQCLVLILAAALGSGLKPAVRVKSLQQQCSRIITIKTTPNDEIDDRMMSVGIPMHSYTQSIKQAEIVFILVRMQVLTGAGSSIPSRHAWDPCLYNKFCKRSAGCSEGSKSSIGIAFKNTCFIKRRHPTPNIAPVQMENTRKRVQVEYVFNGWPYRIASRDQAI